MHTNCRSVSLPSSSQQSRVSTQFFTFTHVPCRRKDDAECSRVTKNGKKVKMVKSKRLVRVTTDTVLTLSAPLLLYNPSFVRLGGKTSRCSSEIHTTMSRPLLFTLNFKHWSSTHWIVCFFFRIHWSKSSPTWKRVPVVRPRDISFVLTKNNHENHDVLAVCTLVCTNGTTYYDPGTGKLIEMGEMNRIFFWLLLLKVSSLEREILQYWFGIVQVQDAALDTTLEPRFACAVSILFPSNMWIPFMIPQFCK